MGCIDIDKVLFIDALRVAYNLKYVFSNRKVWIDKTNKGYHICVDGILPLRIREVLGDDPWRIEVSRERVRIHNDPDLEEITFRWKNGMEVIRVYEA